MSSSIRLLYIALLLALAAPSVAIAQTFFETAKDDGIISFAQKKTSQIKISPTSSAIAYGYNYLGKDIRANTRFIFNAQIKAKPNSDGVASIIKTGKLQPGVVVNAAAGVRLKNLIKPFFSAFDISLKPTFQLDGMTLYDSVRGATGTDPVYSTTKVSYGLNGLVNGLLSPGSVNIFFGVQYGFTRTTNADDLPKGSIQTTLPYAGSASQSLVLNQQDVKYGQLANLTRKPLKVDLIIDPGIKLNSNDETNTKLGFFGYFRNDGKLKKYREGFGVCFLDSANPSRIFSSVGYELPAHGPDVTEAARKLDKGTVFFSVGYSIF